MITPVIEFFRKEVSMTTLKDINPTNLPISPGYSKYLPEPRSSGFSRTLQSIGGSLGGLAGSLAGGMDPTYAALISEQIKVQQQMQLVSFQSNIEKSKHETQMAAVRNIRVG